MRNKYINTPNGPQFGNDIDVKSGDIIQVIPETKKLDVCWRGLLMVVDRVSAGGTLVNAYASAPDAGYKDYPAHRFYLRLNREEFIRIGPSPYLPDDVGEGVK